MKMLFITNIASKRINNFALPIIKATKELNIDFHFVANLSNKPNELIELDEGEYGIKFHHIDLKRNPFHLGNYKAYRQLIKICIKEKIDFIHCNTPIGGLLGRAIGKKLKLKKVIYTAHGFHFSVSNRGLKSSLIKFAEIIMARGTDVLITMNDEDYKAAKKFKLKNNGQVYFVHGVGVNNLAFNKVEINNKEKRMELGLGEDDVILISVGELIKRKNYETSIEAIAQINNPKVKLLICGKGVEEDKLKRLIVNLGLQNQVKLLGYRDDVMELLALADIFLFTTYQEGLPRSLMEAMSTGLPAIVSDVRGNNDLIKNNKGGFLHKANDVNAFSKSIEYLIENKDIMKEMTRINLNRIKAYDLSVVNNEILDIYKKEINFKN